MKSKIKYAKDSEIKTEKHRKHSCNGENRNLHYYKSHLMKKILFIVLASFVLLSGMHLSVAKHFCGDEAPVVKISFSGEKATCGMEVEGTTSPVHHDGLSSNCCRDEVSLFVVDNFDSYSSLQIKAISQQITQVFLVAVNEVYYSQSLIFQAYVDVSPPDNITANAVSLPKICVFRI